MEKSFQQNSMPLCDVLAQYAKAQRVRLSMPGHKGGMGANPQLAAAWQPHVWQWDVTELSMTDQLYHAQGCLKEAQQLLADFLGAKQGYFLVNGASAGLMAAILSVIKPGERILVPRNAHGSIWRGITLAQGEAVVMPVSVEETWQVPLGIDVSLLEQTIQQYRVKAMVAVYPSYHGLCIDMTTIVALCKKHGVKLIVDMAHGGHFPFLPDILADPIALGADIVVQGWHKTMGSLTQTAVAAVQNDTLHFGENLLYFQSTSPSYLLMASLDATRQLWATQGKAFGQSLAAWAVEFSAAINGLPGWHTLEQADFSLPIVAKDCTRILLGNDWQISGFLVGDALADRGIDVEMAEDTMVTMILAIGDLPQKDRIVSRLVAALQEISQQKEWFATAKQIDLQNNMYGREVEIIPAQPLFAQSRVLVKIEQAVGCVAAEMISLYPPGIPLVLVGQVIKKAHVAVLQQMIAAGGSVQGYEAGSVWVLAKEAENKEAENKGR